jgi:Tol biopolymer transport system component
LAYSSNETGRWEIYVQPFGRDGARQQISTGGGQSPIWRRDGHELFYVVASPSAGADHLSVMAVPVTMGSALRAGAPKQLFEGPYSVNSPSRGYDVTPDGQRFIMVHEKERPATKWTEIVLVQNWFNELRRRVPGL